MPFQYGTIFGKSTHEIAQDISACDPDDDMRTYMHLMIRIGHEIGIAAHNAHERDSPGFALIQNMQYGEAIERTTLEKYPDHVDLILDVSRWGYQQGFLHPHRVPPPEYEDLGITIDREWALPEDTVAPQKIA